MEFAELLDRLRPFLRTETGPGPGPFQAVSLEGVRRTADWLDVSPTQAMITLLEHAIWPLRLVRNRGVIKAGEQARLLSCRALVIGCGGLGGQVVTLLARVGLGGLSLCDFDVFDETNLNRQLLSREDNLGRGKAEVAGEEAGRIASHLDIRVHPVRAEVGNLAELVQGVDIVVDCLDSIETRLLAEAAAHRAGLPFIHASIAGDEGLALVSRPGQLRMSILYGSTGGKGAERVLGVPTITPAALGTLESLLVVKELLGRGEEEPALWHFDLTGPTLEPLII